MPGPYATEREAIADARDVLDEATNASHTLNEAKLLEALRVAGVDLGGYDERIACWLGGREPQVVQVVVDWITRAGAR